MTTQDIVSAARSAPRSALYNGSLKRSRRPISTSRFLKGCAAAQRQCRTATSHPPERSGATHAAAGPRSPVGNPLRGILRA